ncbi:zona pellucida sperm-binding protein 3 [Carassius gibelio]|uniref:zona pellucida sperm-binding protein 3 n=1 Tax=Carassius gibelio TaxID=101364 RepID=UPI002279D58D|nr:zona pellucida sperm-binding protein 3 [Carassius gibelio]
MFRNLDLHHKRLSRYKYDWRYERPSNTYFLGDFINLEASVVRANRVPLRVFVESCAATLGRSGEAASMYTIIENSGVLHGVGAHGCFGGCSWTFVCHYPWKVALPKVQKRLVLTCE